MEKTKDIYVVLSQTGSIVAKMIHFFTRAEYCHASIGIDEHLDYMFSFGRVYPRNPFYGGFVKESPHFGAFARFSHARVVVLRFAVPEETYARIKEDLETMYRERDAFRYNYRGFFASVLHLQIKQHNKFYCSEFVDYICRKYHLYEKGTLPEIVHPIDFYKTFQNRIIYKGLLTDFCPA